MIKPTVGRKVWYRPSEHDKTTMATAGDQPLDATIVAVWGDRLINVAIFDAHGMPHQQRSVALIQDEDAPNPAGRYAEWMPYQTTQAAKAEALEEITAG